MGELRLPHPKGPLFAMKSVSLALVALVCCVHARRTQRYTEPEKKAIASMLFASNPASAARRASSSTHQAVNRFGRREPVMQEAAPVVEAPPAPAPAPPKFDVKEMAGVTAPLGFFDPFGYTQGASEGKVRFYREVELKHGR